MRILIILSILVISSPSLGQIYQPTQKHEVTIKNQNEFNESLYKNLRYGQNRRDRIKEQQRQEQREALKEIQFQNQLDFIMYDIRNSKTEKERENALIKLSALSPERAIAVRQNLKPLSGSEDSIPSNEGKKNQSEIEKLKAEKEELSAKLIKKYEAEIEELKARVKYLERKLINRE